jgi:hypothetical protein
MPCHNAQGPKGTGRSEYTTWASYDPHARAFAVLRNERSARIMRNMGWKGQSADRKTLCLNCHVGRDSEAAARNPRFTLADGVGCESCHGAAGQWLTEHYKSGWRQLTAAEKARRGLRDTKSILGRARTCVGCHVGQPGVEVNHDLIAAGHPRLSFEFAAFHAVLPHHWDDRKDKDPSWDRRGRPDFEAAAWAVGQVVSAEAALDLLAWRAEVAAKDPKEHPWPEFAEYDCFACHHDLKARSWRQSEAHYGKRLPGSLPWGDWYFSLTQQAVTGLQGDQGEQLTKALGALQGEMSKAYPPAKGVATEAAKAAGLIEHEGDQWLRRPGQPLPVPDLCRKILLEGRKGPERTWDAAAQLYLGLAAMNNAWEDMGGQRPLLPGREMRSFLQRFRSTLRFPLGFDSPRDFTPGAAH